MKKPLLNESSCCSICDMELPIKELIYIEGEYCCKKCSENFSDVISWQKFYRILPYFFGSICILYAFLIIR